MPSLTEHQLANRILLRTAVDALSLSHREAPSTALTDGVISVLVGPAETQFSYRVVSPEATGMDAKELEAYFLYDHQQPESGSFEHTAFGGTPDLDGQAPLYARSLAFKGKFAAAAGILKSDKSASYCLMAKTNDGALAGFSTFSISLDGFENIFGVVGQDNHDEQDVRSVYLNIHFDCIYTLKRYRGEGVASALITYIGHVLREELENLANQLNGAPGRGDAAFRILPWVHARWLSQSGRLACWMLTNTLEYELDLFALRCNEEPALRCLELLEIECDADY